jgi:hypothetical protein
MCKSKYEELELEIIGFSTQDILVTSPGSTESTVPPCEDEGPEVIPG